MDTGLGAAPDELATLQLTELHPLPQTIERQGRGLASIKSGLAALRDFDAAFDRFGSPPEVAVSALMSALADSGRATGSAWVRVVPKHEIATR